MDTPGLRPLTQGLGFSNPTQYRHLNFATQNLHHDTTGHVKIPTLYARRNFLWNESTVDPNLIENLSHLPDLILKRQILDLKAPSPKWQAPDPVP